MPYFIQAYFLFTGLQALARSTSPATGNKVILTKRRIGLWKLALLVSEPNE